MNFPRKLANNFELMEKLIVKGGIIIPEPENVWISPKINIGRGTIIYPNSYVIGDANSFIGQNCQIGPNAFLRGWFKIGDRVKIGFGAEIVRSSINDGTKAAHFCHIGDAIIGRNCNIAAGVIFCNFDGKQKNTTVVEDDVFIGSNAMITPPEQGLRLSQCCYIGANSVVNVDVPAGRLFKNRREHILSKYYNVRKEDGKWKLVARSPYA
jgi:bifunctional UDP-N-acetylglucosamine pyrophosphorylase/glucosamine-1-phosphate N-acetyltransferase